jgi:hypothetical protein
MHTADTRSIRDAIASEDFARAQSLWTQYTDTLQRELETGRLAEAQLGEARELVEWARQSILAMRAHGQHQLDLLRAVQEYDEHLPAASARLVQTSL